MDRFFVPDSTKYGADGRPAPWLVAQSKHDGAKKREAQKRKTKPAPKPKPILVQGKTTITGMNNGYINVQWALENTDGKQYYVTEQQSVKRLAKNPSGSGRSWDYPNTFDDDIGLTPLFKPVDSIQTFSISLSHPDKNGWSEGSMNVDVSIGGKEYPAVNLHLDATPDGPGSSETGYDPH
jgi:hypothetical protein